MAHDLADIKQRHADLVNEYQARTLAHECDLLEQEMRIVDAPLEEAWGDLVDRSELTRDLSFGRVSGFMDDRHTRQEGRDRPVIETEIDLAIYRATARSFLCEIPPAIAAMRNLVNYVVGTTFGFEVKARDGRDVPPELVATLQSAVDVMIEANAFSGGKDREAYRRSVRDGEAFIRVKLGANGVPQFRFVEPAHITEPSARAARDIEAWLGCDQRYVSSWTFGVHTPMNDTATAIGYHCIWDGVGHEWDYLTPDDLIHIKSPETDENVKRGLTEFYAVRKHLPAAEKVFKNTAHGAAVQAAIAGVRQALPGVKGSDVHRMGQGNGTDIVVRRSASGGTRNVYRQNFEPGTIVDAQGYEWKEGPMGSQRNPNLILAGQAVLRICGARWNMPEWMTSGDASNNNLASSLVAESPFVKSAEAEQKHYGREFVRLLWAGLRAWERSGRLLLDGMTIGQCRQLIEISAVPPEVATRDKQQQATTDQTLHALGVKSRRTIATEHGLDYDAEKKNMADEPQDCECGAQPGPHGAGAPMVQQRGTVQEALESFLLEDCGTGAGGFKSGNSCANEDGGGRSAKYNYRPIEPKSTKSKPVEDVKKLTPSEKNAIQDYSSDKFRVINGELRSGKVSGDTKRIAKQIDNALARSPKFEGEVYRRVMLTPDLQRQLDSGMISDAAYTSTSKNPPVSGLVPRDEAILKIVGKTSGVDVSSISHHGRAESEVLFPRGSKFKIHKTMQLKTGAMVYLLTDESGGVKESVDAPGLRTLRGAIQGAIESTHTAEGVRNILREVRGALVG